MAFYGVYIREAHPVDGWVMEDNVEAGIRVATHQTIEERVAAASLCCGALHLNVPLLVDDIDDKVCEAYSGFPDRLFLIDRDGKIAYKGGRGPFGVQPGELEQSIILLLAEDQRRAAETPEKKADDEQAADEAAEKEQSPSGKDDPKPADPKPEDVKDEQPAEKPEAIPDAPTAQQESGPPV